MKAYRPIYYKAVEAQAEVDTTSRKVSGYFASFGNRDTYGDVIMPGAFTKSIKEHGPKSKSPQKIAYLYQHDLSEPLGVINVLTEDGNGLYFEATIDDTDRGEQVLKQYASGTLNQHSIGFRYIPSKTKYNEDEDTYYLKEVILLEGSVVTIGANENTPFMGMKAADLVTLREALDEEAEDLLRALTADDQLKVRQIITKYIALLEEQPARPLPPVKEPQGLPVTTDWSKIIKAIQH